MSEVGLSWEIVGSVSTSYNSNRNPPVVLWSILTHEDKSYIIKRKTKGGLKQLQSKLKSWKKVANMMEIWYLY